MKLIPFALTLAIGCSPAGSAEPEWVYLQNARLKLGVRKDAGACIGYLAAADGKNVLNSYDHGRFIQQSYYGAPDGSFWVKQPWRYNPVQGGDYKGNPATLQELKVEATNLYSKTQPRHWATGASLPEVGMEQWISLEGDFVRLRARMSYTGTEIHPPQHQEIPAIFLEPEYKVLVLNDGKTERRWEPGWPNEHVKLPEHWLIYLDAQGHGIGAFVPAAGEATCYRFGKEGDFSACSYVAPLTTFALTPGKTFEYEAWFTLGSEQAIRDRFVRLAKQLEERAKAQPK
jgi:hypothetical protein